MNDVINVIEGEIGVMDDSPIIANEKGRVDKANQKGHINVV